MRYEDRNQFAFSWLGIDQWHKAGFTGHGIKVLVVDTDTVIADARYPDKVVAVGSSGKAYGPGNDGRPSDHGLMSIDVIQQVLPDAQVHFQRWQSGMGTAIRYAIKEQIDVVTVSLSYDYNPLPKALCEEAVAAGVLLISSAGNEGFIPKGSIGYPAKKATWVSVGAAFVNQMLHTIDRATYSSTGQELEVMGYTGRYVRGSRNGNIVYKSYTGTSCASPMIAGMLGLMRQKYGTLSKDEMRELMYKHCVDMSDAGHDEQTGWGMMRLPHVETGERIKEIVLKIDDSRIVVDGEAYLMDTEPIIHKDRTMVPVSFIAREFGLDVQWNPQTREVTIRG